MLDPAYVAGIIDGEGCIQFSTARTTLFARVLVTNTNLELLNALQDQYEGDISCFARRVGWKQGYQWRLQGSRAVALLDEVYPFLLVKRLQAETVFAWQACRVGSGRAFNHETASFLVRRMKWLNAKGPQQGEDPAVTEGSPEAR